MEELPSDAIIESIANEVMKELVDQINATLPKEKERTGGGWIGFKKRDSLLREPERELLIWKLPDVRSKHCRAFMQEKLCRMARKARGLGRHVTTFQSRDPELDQWGGGVALRCGWCLAFSHLPEEWDEIFCLELARRLGLTDLEEIGQILAASQNEVGKKHFMIG